MALVAAAVAKLFLFDLGTLDGIFRVVVFIAVGLVLLGMGTGYARLLAQQDGRENPGLGPVPQNGQTRPRRPPGPVLDSHRQSQSRSHQALATNINTEVNKN